MLIIIGDNKRAPIVIKRLSLILKASCVGYNKRTLSSISHLLQICLKWWKLWLTYTYTVCLVQRGMTTSFLFPVFTFISVYDFVVYTDMNNIITSCIFFVYRNDARYFKKGDKNGRTRVEGKCRLVRSYAFSYIYYWRRRHSSKWYRQKLSTIFH